MEWFPIAFVFVAMMYYSSITDYFDEKARYYDKLSRKLDNEELE